MRSQIFFLILYFCSHFAMAQSDTIQNNFNTDFLNKKEGINYADSIEVLDAKDLAVHQPFFRAFSLGYIGKFLIPVGAYNYGVHPVYLNGIDASCDLTEMVANMKGKLIDEFSPYSIHIGFALSFGNYGKIKDYYSVDNAGTTSTYTLSNALNMGSIYVEFEKRSEFISPYFSLAYTFMDQNLTKNIKDKKDNNTNSHDSPLTYETSNGIQAGIGIKHQRHFMRGNGYAVALQATYFKGTPIMSADINEVKFDSYHEPVYTLKQVHPQFISFQLSVSYDF